MMPRSAAYESAVNGAADASSTRPKPLAFAQVSAERHLDWDGCFNARDLGGLRGTLGTTLWGAVVRSDKLDELSVEGWDAVREHGIRTVVDLRDPSEHRVHDVLDERPGTVSTPVFDFDDRAFWDEWDWHQRDAAPFVPGAFYRGALERWPERLAAAVAAVADAPEGGVLIHCHIGRDRTGLVAALVLSLVGIPLDEIRRRLRAQRRAARAALRRMAPRRCRRRDARAARARPLAPGPSRAASSCV